MEEDIKIVEELVEHNYLEDLGYLRDNNHYIRFNQALENLIKGYRELEKENKLLKKVDSIVENIDTEKVILKIEDDDYIPKSKIKSKIEELEKQKEETYTKFLAGNRKDEFLSTKGKMLEGATRALQELIEGE